MGATSFPSRSSHDQPRFQLTSARSEDLDMTFQLPKLPYAFDALEPHIDAKTMEIHHGKHHQGYVDKTNAALESHPELKNKSIEELLSNIKSIPESIRTKIRNAGGGHANHSLFWQTLSPNGGGKPEGELSSEIEKAFESFEAFKEEFAAAATGQFGSGWAWLVVNETGALQIVSTANQDNPLMNGLRPILGLDVWEHAYYLSYQNRRADYVEHFWKLVDWDAVSRFHERARYGADGNSGGDLLTQFPIYQTGIPGTPPK